MFVAVIIDAIGIASFDVADCFIPYMLEVISRSFDKEIAHVGESNTRNETCRKMMRMRTTINHRFLY